jgi:DNA-binding NarL/FixJ family response regulator
MSDADELLGLKSYLSKTFPIKPRGMLSEDQVQSIRRRLVMGHSVKAIAIDLNASLGTIYNIKNNITYIGV